MLWKHLAGRILGMLALSVLASASSLAQTPSMLHAGRLDPGDPQLEGSKYYDEYELEALEGEEIAIVAVSLEFDPYVILISPSGAEVENDDFGGSPDVSLIEVPVDESGTWRVRVTSYLAEETGEYAVMAGTRADDGEYAGHDEEGFGYHGDEAEEEPEEFVVHGVITPGLAIEGALDANDPTRPDGSHYEAYALDADAGSRFVLTLESGAFDSYLLLVSPSGESEFNDDVAEGDLSSRIETTLEEEGRWLVVANTLSAGETGAYRLMVTRR